MPLNWLTETLKWKILVEPFEKMNLGRAFKGVLSGISVALLTPNRIGEYGGRMVVVEAKNNWKAVISTVVSSISQNIWNIGFGLIGLMLYLKQLGSLEGYMFGSGLFLSFGFLFLTLIIYFNLDWVNKLLANLKKRKLVSKILFHLDLIKAYTSKILLSVLFLALVRYCVYFLQYYLILRFFGLELNIANGFIGISTIFLVQTSLPLPPVLGFLARGEIALLVWEELAFNPISILGATYTLWLINLILPSIVGGIIILSSDLWRTLGISSFLRKR